MYVHGPGQYEQIFIKRDDYYHNHLVITCSEEDSTYILNYNSSVKTFVLHPLMDIESIIVKDKYKKKYITMVCSKEFQDIKGLDIFIKIAKKLPTYKFMIVGDIGPQDISCECPENIIFKGIVRQMRNVYKLTKLLIMPSRIESFGMVSREALLNDIPVICTDLLGLRKASYNLANFIPLNELANIELWTETILRVEKEAHNYNVLEKYLTEEADSLSRLMQQLVLLKMNN